VTTSSTLVRVCPYLPFSARICLNQHHWLANRMREKGIGFKQTANAFLKCTVPDRLQELANSLTPRDLVTCGQKWLTNGSMPHSRQAFSAKRLESQGRPQLDRLYQRVIDDLDTLVRAVGLKAA